MKNNIGFVITMSFVILIGLAIIGFGVIQVIDGNEKTKDYVNVKAEFVGTEVYSSDEGGATYSLKYEYVVDGVSYYISTDYGTAVVPKEGTTKTIKYNPEDPSEAIISVLGGNMILFVVGGMFVVIPIVFILTGIEKKEKSSAKVQNIKSSVINLLIGILFSGMGFGLYYLFCDGSDSLSFITVFKNAGFLSLFPIIFIAVGIYLILATLFMKRNKELILTIVSINEDKDGTCNVLLSDDNIHDNSWKTIMYKYFIYSTRNKEKFTEGKKYKVNIYKYGISLELIPIDRMIQAMSLENFCDEDFEEYIV